MDILEDKYVKLDDTSMDDNTHYETRIFQKKEFEYGMLHATPQELTDLQ